MDVLVPSEGEEVLPLAVGRGVDGIGEAHGSTLVEQDGRELASPIVAAQYPWLEHPVGSVDHLETLALSPLGDHGAEGHPAAVDVDDVGLHLVEDA